MYKGHIMDIILEQKQTLELKMSQEQIFALEMLELNSIELEKLITEELCENVMLDSKNKEGTDSLESLLSLKKDDNIYNSLKNEFNDYKEEEKEFQITYREDFRKVLEKEFLTNQISKKEEIIGKYLIYSLNDDGYLDMTSTEIAQLFKEKEVFVENVREKIKTLSTGGFASRSLKEFLLTQIDADDLLYQLVDKQLDKLGKNKLKEIAKEMKLSLDQVINLSNRVKNLKVKPSLGESSDINNPYIYPDIIVLEKDGDLIIHIEDAKDKSLYLNSYYINLYRTSEDKELLEYLKVKYKRAMFFLEAIQKRRETIRKTCQAIVKIQRDFLLNNSNLNICSLKMLSIETGLSESTISRTLKNKYLSSEFGIYPLRSFLVGGVGENKNSKDDVMNLINEIVENEDKRKPFSDKKILDILNGKGIDIKRRTVAKYREKLGILPSNLRKEFN